MNSENIARTILVVEDEAIISIITAKALKKAGYSVITAGTGEKGVEIAVVNDHINLVLMDINLGSGIDGTEAARRILMVRNIPIVFHTSHSEREMVERVRGITRYGYVIKSSGDFVLNSSIEMAFELFEANRLITGSEEKQKAMISNISDVIGIIDKGGIIRYVSPNITELFGWRCEDLTGSDGLVTVHPEDQEYVKEKFMSITGRGNSSIKIEYRYKRRDGSYRPVEITAVNLSDDPAIKGILVNYHDISERKKSEEEIRIKNEEYEALNEELNATIEEMEAANEELIMTNEELGKTAESLRSSREQYLSLFDNMTEGFAHNELVFDDKGNPCDYRFLAVNHAFEELTGLERDNIIGRTLGQVLPEEDPFWIKTFSGVAITGEPAHVEHYSIELGRWYEVYAYSTEINKFAIVFSDITKRKLAEDELKGVNNRFLVIASSVPGYIAYVNADTLVYEFVNFAFEKSFGIPREKIIGSHIRDIIGEDNFRYALKYINEVKEGRSVSYENTFELTSGRRWINVNYTPVFNGEGKVTSIAVFSYDITSHRQAEETLRETNEYLENLINCANAPIIVWDPQFRIMRFNRAFETITGRKADDVLGKHLEILFPDEQVGKSMDLIRKTLSGERWEVVEINIMNVNGSICTVLWNSATLFSADGTTPVATIAQGQDITLRKQAEERIEKLLAEKDLMLKEVHHRIKNNMNTIISLLSLQADTLKDTSAVAALEDAGNRIQSMMMLYDKLFKSADFKKMPVATYIPSLVDEIISNFPNSSDVRICKKMDNFDLDAKIMQPLGIIINELLTNIMKYAFKGRRNGRINISASLDGSCVTFIIEDNGNSLPDSVDFENSTGFGMQLIGMLTEQIGGSIRIERKAGTKFILEFDI